MSNIDRPLATYFNPLPSDSSEKQDSIHTAEENMDFLRRDSVGRWGAGLCVLCVCLTALYGVAYRALSHSQMSAC